ncbi:MAG: sulfite exporter TauE/SafE family protein [Candidatus Eremiobacteraeota bacterium]|nr:sulfite exporter TauE/SafE family protein [Candidatus Eremiobacteraeota bacterium]
METFLDHLRAPAFGLLILYGLVVGISLGLTGGGGSIITVPLLVYLVGQPVHAAIPTSLVIVGATAFGGYLSRLTVADSRHGLVFGLIGLAGAVPGRLTAHYFSGPTLLLLFAIIMLVASYFMFSSRRYGARHGAELHWPSVIASAVAVGFLTGLLGIGGGFLIVPCLVLILQMDVREAIPTSLLVIAINCASSLLGPAVLGHAERSLGAIDWRIAGLFLIGGLTGSWLGGTVAQHLDQRLLKRIFAVLMFALSLFVIGSTTGLIPVRVQ